MKPGLMPVPRTLTPCSLASASMRSAQAASLAHGYESFSAMQITLQPASTAGTTWSVISCRLLCVLMQTTSGFLASTAAKSVVILTSQGRPSSSPTVFPSLAGLVTMTPTRSMSFGRSRMKPRRPWPIMPVPHSATLIMSAPLSTVIARVNTEYAAADATLSRAQRMAGRTPARRRGGRRRARGGEASRRARRAARQEGRGGGGWSTVSCARMESSLPIMRLLGRGRAGPPGGMLCGRAARVNCGSRARRPADLRR